jgi:hypothetical protein
MFKDYLRIYFNYFFYIRAANRTLTRNLFGWLYEVHDETLSKESQNESVTNFFVHSMQVYVCPQDMYSAS